MTVPVERPIDLGLFGPDSVTWRVHAEPILWVGGLRALFLQALHPLAMAGVAQHSAFRDDWWGRLMRTGGYVGTVTYGTTDEAMAAFARVREAHRGLSGIEPESGDRYVVADPRLLLWVHCCQVDSFLTAVRRGGLRLSADEADAYVAEQVVQAVEVGVRGRSVPTTTAELARYFDDVRPDLRLTAAAREARRFLLLPPLPTRVATLTPARPGWALLAGFAFASLPRWARRLYGSPTLPSTDLVVTASSRVLSAVLHNAPETWRVGPHQRAALERVAAARAG